MKYYTYAHYTADSKELFYIGKGSSQRAWDFTHRNTYWKNKANKHGVSVEVLAYWENEQDSLDHEKLLISIFKEKQIQLCNMTDGGEGLSGYEFSEEHKAKIGKAHKGRKKTPEQTERMRSTMLKKMQNPQHREAIRKALTGRKLPDEHKQKIKNSSTIRRPVLCLTTGVEYPSAVEAAQVLNISSSSTIAKCCRGKRKTAGGFEWKYKD